MLLVALLLATQPNMDQATLRKMAARFAPTEVTADLRALPDGERAALAKIVRAARLMDAIYLRQAWAGNGQLLLDLAQDSSPLGRARLQLFLIDKGPWSNLDHDAPFIPGVPPRPEAANFYPPGATKEEIEKWQKSLAGPQRDAAAGFFTVIRRTASGFAVVDYSM